MNTREVHSLHDCATHRAARAGCCLGERWLAISSSGQVREPQSAGIEDCENYHLDFHPIHESEVALLTWLLPLVSPSNPGGGETMQWSFNSPLSRSWSSFT